jgi:hypothetical protein
LNENKALPEEKPRENQTPHEAHALSKNDIVEYISCMYDTAIGDVAIGFRAISRATGIKEDMCRKIKGHLEKLSVISSGNARTTILVSKQQALSRIT